MNCFYRFLHRYVMAAPALLLVGSCQVIRQSPKYGFSEGYYYSRLYHKKLKHIYVVPDDDSIRIYSAKKLGHPLDTASAPKIALPPNHKPAAFESYTFRKAGLDVDVLNILFKLRPALGDFPPQFNNNILNAAFYFGRRSDIYKITYRKNPLGNYRRFITHYGYSIGLFTGFGSSRIDEYVTGNALNIQYDGFVNLLGLCASVALDKVNFGLNLGFDHLLDQNRRLWMYQGKPWLGVSIGLNLN